MIAETDTTSTIQEEPNNDVPNSESEPTSETLKSQFEAFELSAPVYEAVEKSGYVVPTEIQAVSIPPILDGVDVVGQAETGTGKTAAFALPLLSRLDLSDRRPQILVMAPTRELAIQVAEAFEAYGRFLPKLGVATIYGGQNYSIQINQLKRGAQIVVGTPGRVMDHMRRGNLSLVGLTTLVLDEADEMLRMGFAEDMDWVFSQAPVERQTLLFSATLPDAVRKVASKYLTDPKHIRVASKTMTAATVDQRVCCVKFRDKIPTLARILESEVTDGVIVFVKTRETTSRVAEELCQRGYRASALNGDMQQNQRERTVDRLKAGRLDILVATDVAARGLDVDRISHVINFDYPHDPEAYVHRIGRTGRAGRTGVAILLVTPKEKHKLRFLQNFTRQKVAWMDRPTVETVQAVRGEKMMAQVEQKLTEDLSLQKELIAAFSEAQPEVAVEDIAAALAAIAMGHSKDAAGSHERSDRENRGGDRKRERFSTGRGKDRGKYGDAAESRHHRDQDSSSREYSKGKRRGHSDQPWTKYRIEVGYSHGVRPGNIVGAITSESGLVGSDIGGIDIQTHFTTIDLPQDLSEGQIKTLQHLKVAGQKLRLSLWDRNAGSKRTKWSGKPNRPKKKNSGNFKPKAKKGKVKAKGKRKVK